MKKIAVLAMVFAVALSSMAFAGTLTDKVEKLIDTNQARLERTYYPRDKSPYLINLCFGYPYNLGATISYNITEMFAVGIGAGAYNPGFAGGINFKAYILPGTVAPYAGAAVTYLVASGADGVLAGSVDVGVDVAMDMGVCLNVGLVYISSFSQHAGSFSTTWGRTQDTFNDAGLEIGLGYRF